MQTRFHFLRLPHLYHSQLPYLYSISSVRTFVLSLVVLLFPIIMVNHYAYLGIQTAIAYTMYIFLFFYICQLFIITLITKFVAKYDFAAAFPMALLLLIIFFFLFSQSKYISAFFIFAIAVELWWYSYHLYFTKAGSITSFGKQIGMSEILNIVSSALAPLLGAYMIVLGGNFLMLFIAGCVTFVAFLLSLKIEKLTFNTSVSASDIWYQAKTHKRDFLAFIGAGCEETITAIVWPILLYYIFRNVVTVAAFTTVITLLTIVGEYMVGIFTDKYDKTKLERLGVSVVSMSWLGKALFQTPLMLGIFDFIHSSFTCLFKLPLQAISYIHAMHEKEKYMAFREVAYKVGNIIAITIFVAIVLSGLPYWFIFFFASLISLLPNEARS